MTSLKWQVCQIVCTIALQLLKSFKSNAPRSHVVKMWGWHFFQGVRSLLRSVPLTRDRDPKIFGGQFFFRNISELSDLLDTYSKIFSFEISFEIESRWNQVKSSEVKRNIEIKWKVAAANLKFDHFFTCLVVVNEDWDSTTRVRIPLAAKLYSFLSSFFSYC